ncbi:hypothetical protein PCE1_002182 [Barthelona sp. PCE]
MPNENSLIDSAHNSTHTNFANSSKYDNIFAPSDHLNYKPPRKCPSADSIIPSISTLHTKSTTPLRRRNRPVSWSVEDDSVKTEMNFDIDDLLSDPPSPKSRVCTSTRKSVQKQDLTHINTNTSRNRQIITRQWINTLKNKSEADSFKVLTKTGVQIEITEKIPPRPKQSKSFRL